MDLLDVTPLSSVASLSIEPNDEPIKSLVEPKEIATKTLESPKDIPAPPRPNRLWVPRVLDQSIAEEKMRKNTKKAILEHGKKNAFDAYATLEEVQASEKSSKGQIPQLTFTTSDAEAIGPRDQMEDAHFFMHIDEGAIAGVLDGHGGPQVARFAEEMFKRTFSKTLKEVQGNVHQALEKVIDDIHKAVLQHPEWNMIGTTAVLCFIDKTNQIYTASLGDSEANIYRKIDGTLKSIPLSCVRDWGSHKDAERASLFLNMPLIKMAWPLMKNPKLIRFPLPFIGINVSRSIGDAAFHGLPERPGLTHKPKITVAKLMPGDTLILACDGLKDFTTENEILEEIKKGNNVAGLNLPKRLVNHTLIDKNGTDNVTILAINVT